MKFRKNVALNEYTTFKIGGKASFFFIAGTRSQLKEALRFSKKKKLPFFILGEGSNVLAPDEGFNGVVIKIEIPGVKFTKKGEFQTEASVGAGENWDLFVQNVIKKDLYGLENLSGIPGSVGATPIQNVGAYGAEVGDLIKEVQTLDIRTLKVKKFSNSECNFSYRNSFFKTKKGKNFIITKVTFLLSKKRNLKIEYKDLAKYLGDNKIKSPNLEDIREAVLSIRSNKFPDLRKIGTAGSFFKNPVISIERYKKLKEKYPSLPGFRLKNGSIKVPLAYILDEICNLKGFKKGSVGLFRKQPLVFVNFGGGSAKEIKILKKEIEKKVFNSTKIKILPEVTLLK